MEISAEWILASFLSLAAIIGTMARVIYNSLSDRIKAQDKIIGNLQDDVDRLSKGCGYTGCLWGVRDTMSGNSSGGPDTFPAGLPSVNR